MIEEEFWALDPALIYSIFEHKIDVAKEIIEWVRGPEPVGVFVNRDADEINATCTRVGFTLAQLHGHESPETCAAVDVPVTADLESGYDTPAAELVERALEAGVAGINIEDTVHSQGRLHPSADELLVAVTGAQLNGAIFREHLEKRYLSG